MASVGGVGADPGRHEPARRHPLFDHPDVVLTPHLMGMTRRAMTPTFVDAARGVAGVLAGRPPAAVANPEWNHRKATA
jgi:D-3-phosphoglycerate dehydrogenase